MATENLFIRIFQKGARAVKRDIDNIGRSATKSPWQEVLFSSWPMSFRTSTTDYEW